VRYCCSNTAYTLAVRCRLVDIVFKLVNRLSTMELYFYTRHLGKISTGLIIESRTGIAKNSGIDAKNANRNLYRS